MKAIFKKDSKTKYMVTNRYIKYFLYSAFLSTAVHILLKIFDIYKAEINNYYFFINTAVSITAFIVLTLFVLFLLKEFSSDNPILKKFKETDGYINLIFTFIWACTVNLFAIIVSVLSATIHSCNFLFSCLMLLFIFFNLFSIKRCFEVVLIILHRSRGYK